MAASGAFAEAYSTVDHVEQLVDERVRTAVATASELQSSAMDTVSALGNVNLNFNAGNPPALPNIDPSISVNLNLPNISPTSFGTITSNVPNTPALDPVPAIPDLTIPDFVSSIGSLNIPNAPAWTAPPQVPTEPTIDDVVVPEWAPGEPSFLFAAASLPPLEMYGYNCAISPDARYLARVIVSSASAPGPATMRAQPCKPRSA